MQEAIQVPQWLQAAGGVTLAVVILDKTFAFVTGISNKLQGRSNGNGSATRDTAEIMHRVSSLLQVNTEILRGVCKNQERGEEQRLKMLEKIEGGQRIQATLAQAMTQLCGAIDKIQIRVPD